MKHSVEVNIAAPRSKVVALFDEPANLMKWMPDLVRFEPISGPPGQPGATSRLVYRARKKEFELMETVTVRKLPDEFSGTYASSMGTTFITNRFIDNGATTRWIVDTEFKSTGVMKVLTFLMGGVIRAQNRKMVDAFKTFA